MTGPIRLLDLGDVSPVRSQAVYHGLAEGLTEDSPDTIALLRPDAPYFCVGFHQNPAEELDLPWCRERGCPVFHRKIGGGTVYLDRNQLFYQVIVHRSRAPLRVNAIYERFLAAPVAVLRTLGLPAVLEEPNEIEVGGKRIAGTGGGQIGDAMVVTGNVLFDFDYDAMARAWRTPSRVFRRMAVEALEHSVTTLKRELPQIPSVEEVKRLLVEKYAETLGRSLVPGSLNQGDETAIAQAAAELANSPLTVESMGQPGRGLKIARGVYIRESEISTPGGPIRLTFRLRDGIIDDLTLDGAGAPKREAWESLAQVLKGVKLNEASLFERLRLLGNGTGRGEMARSLISAILAVSGSDAQELSDRSRAW